MFSSMDLGQLLVLIPVTLLILLPVAALFSIWRWRSNMETTHVLIWGAVVVFAPFVGSVVWFLAGKSLHPARGIGAP